MFCSNCNKRLEIGDIFCGGCGTEAINSPHHLLPGTILNGRYHVGTVIGEGGFGITYIGRDTVLDYPVAIKEYYPSQFCTRNNTSSAEVIVTNINTSANNKKFSYGKYKERFLDEARTLAKFDKDACIVNVKDFFEANNTAYIIMEYVDGHTLKEHIEEHGALSVDEILRMMRPLMMSLSKVHEAGLIHRDISPDNIKITADGDLKLLDFGAARYFDTEKTVTSMIKAGYAPEEQYRSNGQLGPWTDIYSLCATIYKCITGVTPDDSPRRLHNRMHGDTDIKRVSEFGIAIDSNLEEVLTCGMSVMQNERYQNVGELINAIDNANNVTVQSSQEKTQTPIQELVEQTQFEQYTELLTSEPLATSIAKPSIKELIKAKKNIVIVSISVAIALIAVIVIIGLNLADSNEDPKSTQQLSVVEQLNLGEQYLYQQDYLQALEHFLYVIETETMNPRGYTGAAEAYEGLGQYSNAFAILQQGLDELPGNVSIFVAHEDLKKRLGIEQIVEPESYYYMGEDEMVQYPEPVTYITVSPETLFETAMNTSNWIRININLTDGNPIVLERDRDSSLWTLLTREGQLRLVVPVFTHRGGITELRHNLSESIYSFTSATNGTVYGTHGSETGYEFTWDFQSNETHTIGTTSGIAQTHNLHDTLHTNSLIAIHVSWDVGTGATRFYRALDGEWELHRRAGGSNRVEPHFFFHPDGTVQLDLIRAGHQEYHFFTDGTGVFNRMRGSVVDSSETFRWQYDFLNLNANP